MPYPAKLSRAVADLEKVSPPGPQSASERQACWCRIRVSTSSSFYGHLPPAWEGCNGSAAIAVPTYSIHLRQASHNSETDRVTVRYEGVWVLFLIKLLLLPIWLPFKILLEIAEHSGRRRHYRSRRSSAPALRSSTSSRPYAVTPRQPRPDTRAHWRSLSRGRKALVIAFLSSLAFLVVVISAVGGSGSAGPGSPSPSVPATGVAQASGVASAVTPTPARTHRHRKHHHRRHHVIATPTPAPTPAGCYPTAASGNCYEPGEFCASADAGMTGVAGDGERIICEDNNGLRWEPA